MHATLPRHALLVTLLLAAAGAAAADGPAPVAGGGLAAGELLAAAVRMGLGLALVLGLLVGAAWLTRRFRITGGLRGGLIEVMSGLSLGTRDKVVLLRVGKEQILVGISPAGMRTLHVLDPRQSGDFASLMERDR